MNEQRTNTYKDLEATIGNTSLEAFAGEVPNNNTIWIKRELDNPWGSHYDRVYIDLFQHYEKEGKIQPGQEVFETTSGSAGVSFAGIANELGYQPTVAIPEEVPQARIDALEQAGARVKITHDDYVNGFKEWIQTYQEENPDAYFLNHSMGPRGTNNEQTLSALERIAHEINEEMEPDIFVPAVGNGSSILGPARGLESRVVGFESIQSAVAYSMLNNDYRDQFGIEPGTLDFHNMPGTSYQGIPFPHILNAVNNNHLDDVRLVSSHAMDNNYHDRKREEGFDGTTCPGSLPHWEDISAPGLGKSTRAGIAVAQELANEVEEMDIVTLGYDSSERYDDLES